MRKLDPGLSVLFVLPTAAVGGGANSVVQETIGLTKLGVNTQIAVDEPSYVKFTSSYRELQQLRIKVRPYDTVYNLARHMQEFAITVATTNRSVFDVYRARASIGDEAARKEPKLAYYVQDYEPLFYAPHSEAWNDARKSYTLLKDAVLFAKTKFLQDIVYANHAIHVAKVFPSIDHDLFFPDVNRPRMALSVTAMVRPPTPRRAPKRTIRVMERIANQFGNSANLQVFGCDAATLEASGLQLSPRIANRGRLARHEVPQFLRLSDMFLDLSDYQAFGRTGLESMACGCIPVLPVLGGAAEFAVHGRNAYVVDTRSDDAILEAVRHFVGMSPASRAQMRQSALETAANYTILKAALSELRLFQGMLSAA